MKLLSGPLSLFTAKTRILLAEKNLAHERVEVPFSRESAYEPKHPEVLRINPKGQVPVLIDGNLALYDSTVINEYLEDAYPDPALFPRDARERARCRQLELASDEILFPAVWKLIVQVFYEPDSGDRDADALASARAAIAEHSRGLEAELAGREFLCGAFSVADIAYGVTYLFATSLGSPPPDDLLELAAWLARVQSRPSFRAEAQAMVAHSAKLLGAA